MLEVPNPLPAIQSFTDEQLSEVITQAKAELAARERKRREEVVAKIRALANSVGVSVSIVGVRGRPGKTKSAKPAIIESAK